MPHHSQSNAKTGIRRRPRLSIMGLLLVTACVALGVQLWRTHQRADYFMRRASRLDDENRRLREEYGEFEVEDPGLLYAVQSNYEDTDRSQMLDWKWRVYLPKRYQLKIALGGVSKKGSAAPDWDIPLEAGYHSMRLHFLPDLSTDEYEWRAEVRVHTRNEKTNRLWHDYQPVKNPRWPPPLSTSPDQWPFTSSYERVYSGRPMVRGDLAKDPSQPVVLQRLLVQPRVSSPRGADGHAKWLRSLAPDAKTPGFLVWLEPAP